MTLVASRSARGFSLVELLVAMTICAVISAGVVIAVPPARAAFAVIPAEIELQQRTRVAVDAITQAIRSAGGDTLPAVLPSSAVSGRFTRLQVINRSVNAAQGVLYQHQDDVIGALSLAPLPCPALAVVCGFGRGATAVITDGSGRFDVFGVASTDAATRRLTPDRAFVPRYAAGSVVVEADVDTFQLEAQPDRSRTLVRVSAGRAVLPIVDRVESLTFELSGVDDSGALQPLPIEAFFDGPWLRGYPTGMYDEDVFRIRHVDVTLTLTGVEPSSVRRSIRFGVMLRNAP